MIEQFKADTACILFEYAEEKDNFFDYSEVVTLVSFCHPMSLRSIMHIFR